MSKTIKDYFDAPLSKKSKPSDEDILPKSAEADTSRASSNADDSIYRTENAKEMSKEASATPIYPSCWTNIQAMEFCKKYRWLLIQNGFLGCLICQKVEHLGLENNKGVSIRKEWSNIAVTFSGDSKEAQTKSLRNKIYAHRDSQAHVQASKIVETAKKQPLETTIAKLANQDYMLTEKLFRCAYYIAKENRPYTDYPKILELHMLNGIDVGRILHSRTSCTNIINHIAIGMKKRICSEIVESNSKIAILIDESTTLSKLTTLIIYLRIFFEDTVKPMNLFLDLVELPGTNAETICEMLLLTLAKAGLDRTFLQNNLIALSCDGAAVMLGDKSGVATRLKTIFPNLFVWHCYNHRLELAVGDVIKETTTVNHFKSFMDKLYALYHASPKNARELKECATDLDVQLRKIGRVLDIRWVASSFRTVQAVWDSFNAICEHLRRASVDTSRLPLERSKYLGLWKYVTRSSFILNLGVMADALQELSELSLEFQKRDITLYKAYQCLTAQAEVFKSRESNPGPYYLIAKNAAETKEFKGVLITECNKAVKINPRKFYFSLQKNLQKRMLRDEDKEIPLLMKTLDPMYWPENIQLNLTYGESEINQLCSKFKLNPRPIVRDFRYYIQNYKENPTVPENLQQLLNYISVIPISSSECERGFLQMNLIITDTRSKLITINVSCLMFVKMVGPPISTFDPSKFIKSWIASGHTHCNDTKSRLMEISGPSNIDLQHVWKWFEKE